MIELHPVELGYLTGGADLATIVACTGLYRRGVLVRGHGENAGTGLVIDANRSVAGHPVERAVAAAVAEGLPVPQLAARVRAGPAMDEVRAGLVDRGLLRRAESGRVFRWRRGRTPSGDRLVEDVVAAVPRADATDPADAARRVAVLGVPALRSTAPGLARALGISWSPKAGRFDAATIVGRGIRHRTLRRSRGRVSSESAGYSFEDIKSAGYDHGWGGGDGGFG